MIITRTPFRISYVGGGTDFKDYYKHGFGNVISTTIDKYIYVTLIPKFDGRVYLRYSKVESLDTVSELEHDIVRETLKLYEIPTGVEITMTSDIPARGSGLGSSSSLTTAMIRALIEYTNKRKLERYEIAEMACNIEIDTLKQPIGKQDQYAAAFGGFNKILFTDYEISMVGYSNDRVRWLNRATLLFYLGNGRKSGDILCNHQKAIPNKINILDKQRDLVNDFDEWLLGSGELSIPGKLVSKSWKYKKQMTPGATNSFIDDCIDKVLNAGAYGAKVCGAGNGGFLMVICEPDDKDKIINVLNDLKWLDFGFERHGVTLMRF